MQACALLVLLLAGASAQVACNNAGPRTDCGYVGITQQQCSAKNCCWNPVDQGPWCFFSNGQQYQAYQINSIAQTANGLTANLTLSGQGPNLYGADINPLKMDVFMETQTRLHVKIYDPNNARWEVPQSLLPRTSPSTKPSATDYTFSYTSNPFGFAVQRASDSDVLFNTTTNPSNPVFNGMIFEDQYIEISTQLAAAQPNIYGLGEREFTFKLDTSGSQIYTAWASDHAMPYQQNLYGSHQFYVEVRPSTGQAHGVLLLTSNGIDVLIYPGGLTYRIIGGILDFYFFTGPTPESVISQYQQFIGLPHMPPYWALGWHQCRYGYSSIWEVEDVVANYSTAQIPLDTMWTDIDYMDSYQDFTWDPSNFPQTEVNNFVSRLHTDHQQYVVIVDPAIHYQPGYAPYDTGLAQGIFVKDAENNTFVGQVWPGLTVFPDWFNPAAAPYWADQIEQFLAGVPLDGLWIDMNEASNFCDGECPSQTKEKKEQAKEQAKKLGAFNPNNPPYAINNWGGKLPLDTHAVSLDATHYGGVIEYNSHNLYGFMESIATRNALETIQGRRSFVLSRSTFPGSGKYVGHWTGDNESSFQDLYLSIPGILDFQMFGVPLVGADICGFNGDTTEELCGRWMELGAFYPFARNHNTFGAVPQEPYRWASVAEISRSVLAIRYSLLPYYYTLFYFANQQGGMVWRPLIFEFPTDANAVGIDQQVLVGPALMLSPALNQGQTAVEAYFPNAVWYDFRTGEAVQGELTSRNVTLPADFYTIPLHVRGGYVLPMQQPALTTYETRANPFQLLVALDQTGAASGQLYWDDGVSLSVGSNFVLATYTASFIGTSHAGKIISSGTFGYSSLPMLQNITVYGLDLEAPKQAILNSKTLAASQYSFNVTTNVLSFVNLGIAMTKSFALSWQ